MFSTGFNFISVPTTASGGALTCSISCYTTSGSWSCCAGTVCAEVVLIAGGGGGGAGTSGGNTNTWISTGGGGGGAGAALACTISSGLSATECVIVGSGGASQCFGNNGGAGGASCFGAFVIANGGAGGIGARFATGTVTCTINGGAGGDSSPNGGNSTASSNFSASTSNTSGGSALGKPGAGGGGGAWAQYFGSCSNNNGAGGGAGSTFCGITLGTGGAGGNTSSTYGGTPTNGSSGSGYGAGGGGGAGKFGPGTLSCSGAGQPGFVKVTQYYPAPVPPAYAFLFDTLTGSPGYYGNFSLRKLNPSYVGDCIEIRRESDDTTTDIGFVDNLVDEASINSFCSGTTCHVKTWYDQSGYNYDFDQTTNSQQPIIYQAGAIETLNGLPAIYFDSTQSHHLLSPEGWLQYVNVFSYVHVGAVDNFAGSNTGVFGPYNTYLQGLEVLQHNVISVPTLVRLQGDAINDNATDFFGDNTQDIMELYADTDVYAFRNGTDLTSTLSNPYWTGNFSYFGRHAMMNYAGACSTGKMQEWNIFDNTIYSQRTDFYNNIANFYL